MNHDGGTDQIVKIDGTHRVFRMERSGGSCQPNVLVASKYNIEEMEDVVQWEFHITNASDSNEDLYVQDPIIAMEGDSEYFDGNIYPLTDKIIVSPGETCVYVFRADCRLASATWGLAYSY